MPFVDLNCDVGEGAGQDAELMALISSANIACGGHAGDAATMRSTMALAAAQGVAAGAHPGYEDRAGFGRGDRDVSPALAGATVESQIRTLLKYGPLRHVKPHGALYNRAARDHALATSVAAAVRRVDPALVVFAPAGSALFQAARDAGLRTAAEFFADRGYLSDGSLVPRGRPGASITDEPAAVQRVLTAIESGLVRTVEGGEIKMEAETICLHGDGPLAVPFARAIRRELDSRGWSLRPAG